MITSSINNTSEQLPLNETYELQVPKSERKIQISPTAFRTDLKADQIPVYDLNTSNNSNDSLMTVPISNSSSIDKIQINEISVSAEDSKCINAACIRNKLKRFITEMNDPEMKAVLNGSIEQVVAEDCTVYMELSNQMTEIKKFYQNLSNRLILKKV